MGMLSVNGRSVSVDVDPEHGAHLRAAQRPGPQRPEARMRQRAVRRLHRARRRPRGALLPDAGQGARRATPRSSPSKGLGSKDKPHPLQAAFIAEQALQCGYCTNGMIMEGAALLAEKPNPTEAQIRQRMNTNLCRCGCQQRVVRAIQRAAGKGV